MDTFDRMQKNNMMFIKRDFCRGRNHARLQNWSAVATRLQLCGVVVGEGGGRLSVDRRESDSVKNK